MENKKDIFDRIMALPVINIFEPFYKKYKEQLMYLFFGVCTTVVSIIIFSVGVYGFKFDEITANNISWVVAVAFAYVTNRTWVFTEKANTFGGIAKEIFLFAAGRFATLWLENGILWLGIEKLGIHVMVTKIIGQVTVIVTNYIISKFFVFRKKD